MTNVYSVTLRTANGGMVQKNVTAAGLAEAVAKAQGLVPGATTVISVATLCEGVE